MRIALVSEHANPLALLGGEDAGGQNVHVANLAAGLAARGHEVVVHTRRDARDLPDRVETDAGYVVEHVPAGPATALPKDELAPHMAELADGLAERWRQDPVDVAHAHFWMSGMATTSAARMTGRPMPVLQTFHALGVVKRRHQGDADTSPPYRVDVERQLLRDVDHVIATCSDEVNELRAMGMPPGRSSVIPCGVDTDRFRPGAPGSAPPRACRRRIASIGRMVPRKGVATVIAALGRLPDTELLVVGGPPGDRVADDPEARRLLGIAQEHEVADRVRFVGAVPSQDVPAILTSADVVVTAAEYEPFGIVPVEAMACGVPVVATDVGGHRDTVVPGRTGELVAPGDPNALARALRGLLGAPRRRQAYGAAGRERAVDLYDWSTVVERTELVYEAAVRAAQTTEEVGA
jgi:glycosyltransferase involved in cell wall biosynthesis